MIKFTRGYVENGKTGKAADIVIKAKAPNCVRDALIGGGLVVAGIIYLTTTAFKKGAIAYEEAEFKALDETELI